METLDSWSHLSCAGLSSPCWSVQLTECPCSLPPWSRMTWSPSCITDSHCSPFPCQCRSPPQHSSSSIATSNSFYSTGLQIVNLSYKRLNSKDQHRVLHTPLNKVFTPWLYTRTCQIIDCCSLFWRWSQPRSSGFILTLYGRFYGSYRGLRRWWAFCVQEELLTVKSRSTNSSRWSQ